MRTSARSRQRAMERRLRELDRVDARYGLGAMPRRGPVRSSRLIAGLPLLVTVVGLAALLLFTPIGPPALRSAFGNGPTRLGHPPIVHGVGSYEFLTTQPHSADPVAWDPCQPVRYRINPASGPQGAVALVQEAVARASAATGLHFEYDGLTGDRPAWDTPTTPRLVGREPPVLIAWATADEVHQLAGNVAGIGGAVAFPQTNGRLRYVTGGVTLDADSDAELAQRPDGRVEERAILLHELGHLVGLAHVQDPHELMNADNVGVTTYGTGDRRGLARLGRGSCF